jgi:hypothetical protein
MDWPDRKKARLNGSVNQFEIRSGDALGILRTLVEGSTHCCVTSTTGVATLRLVRRFVGIELKANDVAVARRRIAVDGPLTNADIDKPLCAQSLGRKERAHVGIDDIDDD